MKKDNDDIIITDNHFTEEQQRIVSTFLSTIIPPHEDGSMPGAGEMDILAYSRERGVDLVPVLEQALEKLAELAGDVSGASFDTLTDEARQSAVSELAASRPDIFMEIVVNTYAGYYRDDQVLEAIGLPPRAPFPEGNTLEQGDMSLLDVVRERAKFYRE